MFNLNNSIATIRETFRFIKEKEDYLDDYRNVNIVVGLSIKENQSNYKNNFLFGVTSVSGIITKVCKNYAELLYTNSSGQSIKTVVLYDGIIVFNHPIINEYFDEYVKIIEKFTPICIDNNNGNNQLLNRLGTLLESSNSETLFDFAIDGALIGNFRSIDIYILRDLVILFKILVVPVTKLSSFAQVGYCEE